MRFYLITLISELGLGSGEKGSYFLDLGVWKLTVVLHVTVVNIC